ncbi:SRPBCC family protein [Chitinophaga sp. Cy-1792]|uniref:SRPBCC family protein n=1 Tax=Chitinophaga sp. Cy-1792 TaxID=2608339 RepID=UPI001421215C|nr:SRPBCC family protein [Chitinophaga sp. Cy-1792]NIG54142.1 polyketide cyclase [Chitinophaga sp. Cy-1792]
MWTRSYTVTSSAITKEQLWHLYADVNSWPTWDDGLEATTLNGPFEAGNYFMLKPKGGPKVKVLLSEVKPYQRFTDITLFPLAKMYDEHIFEETPEGLRITNRLTVKGLLGFLWVKLVAKQLADSLPEDMNRKIAAASKL